MIVIQEKSRPVGQATPSHSPQTDETVQPGNLPPQDSYKKNSQHCALLAPPSPCPKAVPQVSAPTPSVYTRILLSSWLAHRNLLTRRVAWEIGFHLATMGLCPSGMPAELTLRALRPTRYLDLCGGPPEAWYADWFGTTQQRRNAVIGGLCGQDEAGLRHDEVLYGEKFLVKADRNLNLLKMAMDQSYSDVNLLVAMRRLVDKMLLNPENLQQALQQQRRLRIKSSPDHNHEVASEEHFQKMMVYRYHRTANFLKVILDHPFYGEAIFRVPPGNLGLRVTREDQESKHRWLKTGIVLGILFGIGLAMGGLPHIRRG